MNNALASLAMDLKRAALGYHRGSIRMAERFYMEAVKRKQEIDMSSVKPYIQKLLKQIESANNHTDPKLRAENFLTYSILFQNASIKLEQS